MSDPLGHRWLANAVIHRILPTLNSINEQYRELYEEHKAQSGQPDAPKTLALRLIRQLEGNALHVCSTLLPEESFDLSSGNSVTGTCAEVASARMSLPDTGPQQGALISLPEAAPSESKSEFKPAQEDRKRTSAASNINRPAKKASQDRPTDASTSSCCGGAAAQPSDNRKAQASREAPSERQDSSSPVPPMEDDSGITPSSSPIAAIKNALSEHQLPLALAEHLVKVGQNGRACFFEVATQRNAVANVARLSSGGQFVQSDRSSWESLQRVMRDADTLEDHELIATLNQIYRKYQGPGMGAILLRRYAQLYISRAFDRTRPADAPENVNWRHPQVLRLLQVARIGVQTAQHHRSAGHRLQNLTQGRDGILALLPIARESRWTDPVTGRVVTSSDAVQKIPLKDAAAIGALLQSQVVPEWVAVGEDLVYTILAGRPPSSRLVRASSIHTALPVIRDSAESTAKGS